MNRIRLGIVSACVWAFALAASGSASGLELFVTGQKSGPTQVFGKLTIDLGTGDVAYSEISTIADNHANLAPRNYTSYYSINAVTSELESISDNGSVSTIVAQTNDYLGLATIGSTLYGADTVTNKLGTIDTSTGVFSGVGSGLGITLSGAYGRMTAIGSTIYLTNGTSNNATFGTVNTGTGVYSTIRTSTDYDPLLLASYGSTLFGINGTTMRVSTIDPATGLMTVLNPTSGTLPDAIYGVVPEPGTYVLAIVAACVLAIAGKWKFRGRKVRTALA